MWLLRCEDQDSDLWWVWHASVVCDSQPELVHSRRQFGHPRFIFKGGFLKGTDMLSCISVPYLQLCLKRVNCTWQNQTYSLCNSLMSLSCYIYKMACYLSSQHSFQKPQTVPACLLYQNLKSDRTCNEPLEQLWSLQKPAPIGIEQFHGHLCSQCRWESQYREAAPLCPVLHLL